MRPTRRFVKTRPPTLHAVSNVIDLQDCQIIENNRNLYRHIRTIILSLITPPTNVQGHGVSSTTHTPPGDGYSVANYSLGLPLYDNLRCFLASSCSKLIYDLNCLLQFDVALITPDSPDKVRSSDVSLQTDHAKASINLFMLQL